MLTLWFMPLGMLMDGGDDDSVPPEPLEPMSGGAVDVLRIKRHRSSGRGSRR